MRDPNRIDLVLQVISKIWKQHPDLRLGQLILNVINQRAVRGLPGAIETLLYNVEDDNLLDWLSSDYLSPDNDDRVENMAVRAMLLAGKTKLR